MAKGKEIHFRIEEEFSNMIDFLFVKEEADVLKENRISMNKSQIIKQAIREYYVRYVDKKSDHAFSESIQKYLESRLDDSFNKTNAMMTGKLILLQDFIKEINLKELLMLKLKNYVWIVKILSFYVLQEYWNIKKCVCFV